MGPMGCSEYFDCHGCPVEEAEDSYYADVLIPVREIPITNIQPHKRHDRKNGE